MLAPFLANTFGAASTFLDFGLTLYAWGWLFVVFLVLWLAWEAYKVVKMIEYVSAIQWTYLQITVPDDAEQTPKAMEVAYNIWAGIHKGPDLIEKLFEGYLEAWFSCELQCQKDRARYIMVVPTIHRQFFEGVIYGQYPTAEIKEVEDYTLRYDYHDIGTKFDIYGTDIVLSEDDILPIKTYLTYEDALAPEDRYIDPHQALVEAYTNVNEDEEYWMQVLVRPVDHGVIAKWTERGEEAVAKISGQAKEKKPGVLRQIGNFFTQLPGELIQALTIGPVEKKEEQKQPQLRFFNPVDDAKMKGILQKVSQAGFRTKIRVIYIAPAGKMNKPNISRAIGVFKQFNTYHLNGFKPDPATKSNGPNYIMKQTRRAFRQRRILLNFQWRDFFGANSGYMMNAEELATVYHFPGKWIKSPLLERAKAGLGSAPENIPYA